MLLIVYVLNILSVLITDFAAVFEEGYSVRNYYVINQQFLLWSIYVLPGLLLYSMYDEWNTGTSHQLLSLPVSRYYMIACKLFAVLTVALIVLILITAINYLFEQKIFELFPLKHQISNQAPYAWNMFAIIVWFLGIAAVAGAGAYALQKHRFLAGSVLFVGLHIVSGKVIKYVRKALESLFFESLDSYAWFYFPGVRMNENEYITLSILNGLYIFILGILFLAIGLYIFKRYDEV
ncbi:hypothetical protein ACFL5B_02650 [Candidatus Latescibacterota bacterium]